MTAVASSSTKGIFPHTVKFDELISEIPHFYSTSSSIIDESSSSNSKSFRTTLNTTTSYLNDPELFFGDDCDTYYEDTLMNSDLLQYLNSDIDGFSKANDDMDVNIFCSPEKRRAHKRLEMLLAHVNQSFSSPTTIDLDSNKSDHTSSNKNRNKGKGKRN